MSKKGGGSRKRLSSTSDYDSLHKWPYSQEPYSLKDPLGLEIVKQNQSSGGGSSSHKEKRNHSRDVSASHEVPFKRRRKNSSSHGGNRRGKSKSAEKAKAATTDEDEVKTTPVNKKVRRRKSQSVEKRSLPDVSSLLDSKPKFDRFQFGNYKNVKTKSAISIVEQRMQIFRTFRRLFESRSVLDVGCGTGDTLRALSTLGCSRLLGVDRDSSLIRSANNASQKLLKNNSSVNLSFKVHNFVPPSCYENTTKYYSPTLLDNQTAEYDCVMMLSASKWIQLTYGDSGLKACFNKVYKLLKKGGAFILESQMWPSYKVSKKTNDAMFRNFNSIEFFPTNFPKFLIDNCLFTSYHHIGDVEKTKKGKSGKDEEKTVYKRPVFVFYKL